MLILYTSEDGETRIQLRAENDTVWLSQLEMGENTARQYHCFDERRKVQDAHEADLEDGADLKVLEDKLKHRPKP